MNTFIELSSFLNQDIPESKLSEDGFLEIANIAHKENTNSRIYCYFLEMQNNDKIAKLFISSLLEIIEEKSGKNLTFDQHKCEIEVSTNNGRIDLVIQNIDNSEVIIIENKLFHQLNNDLLDYWNHFNILESKKVGVVLTLESHKIPKVAIDKFINIRHIEWINRIQRNGLPSNLPSKFYVYLNDFFETIKKLTRTFKMNDQALFYFQNSKKIIQVQETINEANNFIESQLQILAEKLNLSLHGKSMEWRNLWDKDNDRKTFYTIYFEDIMIGNNTIQIIIGLEGEDIKKADNFKKLLKSNSHYNQMLHDGEETSHYIHFARREYKLNINDIRNFANFVFDKISSDFEPVMKIILEK